ncbi:hypothetical protein AB205_0206560 [Aquarana catesbeiana]|uniref:Uncharacterized protein n=1 Tax=Aquarana catesbeiana TaxID=8400 RepID=A0A2G9NB30_AQUCT|nr:hypothetical protein AB205_0206560 [Aquarana catesbeiana]
MHSHQILYIPVLVNPPQCHLGHAGQNDIVLAKADPLILTLTALSCHPFIYYSQGHYSATFLLQPVTLPSATEI